MKYLIIIILILGGCNSPLSKKEKNTCIIFGTIVDNYIDTLSNKMEITLKTCYEGSFIRDFKTKGDAGRLLITDDTLGLFITHSYWIFGIDDFNRSGVMTGVWSLDTLRLSDGTRWFIK